MNDIIPRSYISVREALNRLGLGLLSVPFRRSEASWAKGNRLRTLVQPPPSSHCDLCGGELRLKRVEAANRMSYRALWTTTNMPPHIKSESVFREMKLRSHYEKPSESKTREKQREKHEKTAQHVAIGSAPEDKKA
jgi:hypothetical protein